MSYDLDDIIEHYGVKGMKWGVRKDPDRVAARKKDKMEKKADKKWAKSMTQDRINKAMTDADSRTNKQQEEAAKRITKTDLFKRAESGDRQAMIDYNFEWTKQYASILNADMRKQAELKSPSGKQALEVLLAQYGDQTLLSPRIVKRDESGVVAMSYDLDDVIEHYGVKGMKWGVRKKVGKAVEKTTIAVGKQIKKRRDKQDAYHDKRMKSSKAYKLVYEGTLPTVSRGRDRKRQKAAKATYRGLQANVAMMVVGGALAAASSKNGQRAIKAVSNFVVSGQAQKIGKNVLNTVMGNPLRYVNAENMKNIVVDSGALGGG